MQKILVLIAATLVLGGCSTATWVNDAGWTCDGVSCRAPKSITGDQTPLDG